MQRLDSCSPPKTFSLLARVALVVKQSVTPFPEFSVFNPNRSTGLAASLVNKFNTCCLEYKNLIYKTEIFSVLLALVQPSGFNSFTFFKCTLCIIATQKEGAM
ncbi:hypothetical protein XENOCAPTIV_015518 [Xenoophorus captivus]|uniref:Uncharacterized protein n=1 Tax=Xenoophorus captivus TaxID=1517983 RepID=A0ABV0Q577_9TELE